MKIVYKLSYGNDCERGLVLQETKKQYKVRTVFAHHVFGFDWTWNKSDCFETVEAAQDALIKRAEREIESVKNDLARKEADLDIVKQWHTKEAENINKIMSNIEQTEMRGR